MKFALLSSFLWFSSCCHALFREDAGKLDFLVATTGHGPAKFVVAVDEEYVITSDYYSSEQDDKSPTSCYVASRRIQDGSIKWRRNVCSSSDDASSTLRHAVAVSSSTVVTVDNNGSVNAWDVISGAVLWSTRVAFARSNNNERHNLSIRTASKDSKEFVVVVVGSVSTVLDAATGEALNAPSANDLKSDKPKTGLEAYCAKSSLLASFKAETGTVVAWRSDGPGSQHSILAESERFVSMSDAATGVYMLSCSETSAVVLLTTSRGTTVQVTFETSAGGTQARTGWRSEDGLAQVSSALLLDASHYVGDSEEAEGKNLLELSNRLQSQWNSLLSFFSSEASVSHRDHVFGFVKVAILLSSSADRVIGMNTSGGNRGQVRYRIDLPRDSDWHRLVHGIANAESGAHGIKGASHNRDVLILSSKGYEVKWKCVDGSNGHLHSEGSVALSSPVAQVVPLAATGTCRQGALLVAKDNSLTVVPEAVAIVEKEIQSSKNGFYTHVVDKKNGKITAARVIADESGLKLTPVGTALFVGEEIVATAYPSRDEVVQSPYNVLGDDSLLLKYLNPHLAVFISKSTGTPKEDEFAAALKSAKKTPGKRKPVGVSQDAAETSGEEATPNLFINVVDTVSGRILYRASHANAGFYPAPTAIVSENWVVYTYVNEKTRRSEVGVLSLYEGMIDSKGITAFTSPDQIEIFSSLDARTSKPVVLAKTYSLAKPATALSMTLSRGGISNRRLLMATIDGQITGVDRKVIDPRRPIGQLKDSEKKEGLHQYTELIPVVPLMSLSYNQTVESVASIITAPTHLESQSLVLAFGGPDIFFARTSPSRGFDLLPDSFNRILLSIVVVAIFIVLVVVQGMVSKKVRKSGWV